MSIRLFIAIDIADDIKKMINVNINHLKDELNNELKWIQEKNMHITLKYLGETKEDSVQAIIKKMNYIIENTQQQSVKIEGIAAFPRLDYPRVIYIGLKEGANELSKLHSLLENELFYLGFKQDKNKYTPHITIARTRHDTNIKQLSIGLEKCIKVSENKDLLGINILIKKISLMKSTLTNEGPIYKEIHSVILKNN